MQNKIQSIIEINNQKLKQCVTLIDGFPTLDLNLSVQNMDPDSHVLHNLIDRYEYDISGALILKDVIFNNLKQELIFSNTEEILLIKKIIENKGKYSPKSLQEIFSAKNMIFRMLCSKQIHENRFYLSIDSFLLKKMIEILNDPDYLKQHDKFIRYLRNCDALLYYIGFVPLYLMIENFLHDLKVSETEADYYHNLIIRYILSHYRYIKMKNDSTVIVHEGWTNLIDLNNRVETQNGFAVDMTEELFETASKNILPNEIVPNQNFVRSISSSIQPPVSAEDVAYSARLLIKQDVSLEGIKSALRPMFLTSLTPLQEHTFSELFQHTTRWISLTSKNLN